MTDLTSLGNKLKRIRQANVPALKQVGALRALKARGVLTDNEFRNLVKQVKFPGGRLTAAERRALKDGARTVSGFTEFQSAAQTFGRNFRNALGIDPSPHAKKTNAELLERLPPDIQRQVPTAVGM